MNKVSFYGCQKRGSSKGAQGAQGGRGRIERVALSNFSSITGLQGFCISGCSSIFAHTFIVLGLSNLTISKGGCLWLGGRVGPRKHSSSLDERAIATLEGHLGSGVRTHVHAIHCTQAKTCSRGQICCGGSLLMVDS